MHKPITKQYYDSCNKNATYTSNDSYSLLQSTDKFYSNDVNTHLMSHLLQQEKKYLAKKNMYTCGYPTIHTKKYQPLAFFRGNLQKIIEDLYLFTKKLRDLPLLCHLM